jgi:hypothetical protein
MSSVNKVFISKHSDLHFRKQIEEVINQMFFDEKKFKFPNSSN